MSNSKMAIKQIKDLMHQFGFLSQEVELLSFKLADETIIQTEKLEVGKKIVKIGENFEQVALEDGTYRIENFNVEVKEGSIAVINEVFVDAKLVDGTQIKVEGDSVVEGAKVMVVTEEGEIPAPDGVHELENGMKVETKEGVVVKVEEKEVEESPVVEVEVESKEMKELYSLLEDMMKKVSDKMKKMEEKMSSMENQFNSFKSEPAAKKIADRKVDFNTEENNSDSKIATIMNLRKNKKK